MLEQTKPNTPRPNRCVATHAMPSAVHKCYEEMCKSAPVCGLCMSDAMSGDAQRFVNFCACGYAMCLGCYTTNYADDPGMKTKRKSRINPHGYPPAVETSGGPPRIRCPSCRQTFGVGIVHKHVRPLLGLNALVPHLRELKEAVDKDDRALSTAQREVDGLSKANEYLVRLSMSRTFESEGATFRANEAERDLACAERDLARMRERAERAERDLARISSIVEPAGRGKRPRVFVGEADDVGFVPTAPSQLAAGPPPHSYRPTTPSYVPTSPDYSPTSPYVPVSPDYSLTSHPPTPLMDPMSPTNDAFEPTPPVDPTMTPSYEPPSPSYMPTSPAWIP